MKVALLKRIESLEHTIPGLVRWKTGEEAFDVAPADGVMCAALLDAALVSFVPNDPAKLRELFSQCVRSDGDGKPPIKEAARAVSKLMGMTDQEQIDFFQRAFDLRYAPMGTAAAPPAGNSEADDVAAQKTAGVIGYLMTKQAAAKAGKGSKGNGRSSGGGSSSAPTKLSPAAQKAKRSRGKSKSKKQKEIDRRGKTKTSNKGEVKDDDR